jgi:sirohydrochlorin cobaltochelatase
MAAAPMKYSADGSVDWGNMWDTFCALAQEGGPSHRGALLRAPTAADPKSAAYQFALAEIARGIARVSGLESTPAEPGWLAVDCPVPGMADWLAAAIYAEQVQARADGRTLYLPVGEWCDVTREIKNVITVVAKTTHYWLDHLSSAGAGLTPVMDTAMVGGRHVPRVHSENVVLDIGQDMGSLVIHTHEALRGAEIELVNKGNQARRTHVDVAERRHNGRVMFAAVYPPVPAGEYTIWVDYTTPAGDVTIVGGEVTQLDWRAERP